MMSASSFIRATDRPMRVRLLVFPILLIIAGCTFQKDKRPAGAGAKVNLQAETGYPTVRGTIFQSKCVGCHSSEGRRDGGVALDSYALVRASITRVNVRALEQKDMPPGGLPEAEQAVLRAWIETGAPEKMMKGRNRKLEGSPNWNLIRDNVLSSCLECHAPPVPIDGLELPGEPIAGLNLTEYDVFRKNKETIINRVIYSSDHPLPPYPTLSEDDKMVLMRWIVRGMPR